ncbi:amino acid adenylation domain-containing protein [Streptomyces daliensis]|uniref:Amino acid adenylation domain-containing protein n=1 Tax=Streptomyces daliensis TaxID=299421 RepID=A0A8T4IK77_9ACTN|nr:amino acid adenylation domain-containing protein [Streptomyces daliensis]
MTRSRVEDVWPLSPLQEGMLFHATFDDEGPDVYQGQRTLELVGPLDVARLRRSWEGLLARHAVLRASFRRRKSGEAVQVIARQVALPWRETDLSGMPEADALTELDRLAEQERTERLDLTVAPLLRMRLVRLGEERHRLMITSHHILMDGWSLPILINEMFTVYVAGGDTTGLPRTTSYRDYLAWLSRQDKDAARDAWRAELAGVDEPTLVAPADPARSTVALEGLTDEIPPRLSQDLVRMARGNDLTVNSVIQGAWALVLSRLTGRDDVVFGATSAGRPTELPGVESMVGLTMNTLPVRVRLQGGQSVLEMLTELQARQSALMAHQHIGLPEVQRVSGPGATFDTLVVYENYPRPPAAAPSPDTFAITFAGGQESAHYPLTLLVAPGERMPCKIDYRPDLFDRDTIQSVLDRLVRVLEQMVADPSARLADVEVLDEAERALVVGEWNDTARAVSAGSVPELFAGWAASTPGVVAVRCGDQVLSYGELEERSNRLGRYLTGLGVGRESRVGLCLPRGVEMVVGMLGVWKAGGAYVPLDPEYPADRLAYMVSDSAATVVLATGETVAQVEGGAASVVVLDDRDVATAIASESSEPSSVSLVPEQLAYVIYTSGSTGRPKGVAVAHGGVANLAEVMRPVLGVEEGVTALQFASFSFDAAVLDVAVTLGGGGTLAVASSEERLEPQALAAMIREAGVSVASVVPSLLGVLEPESVPGVENWVLGAERLSADLAARWRAQSRVWNTYGPTEATVITTATLLAEGITAQDAPPAIGGPIGNAQVFVLDGFLRPVPPGVTGELYVAGAGLARGYVGRPDLTAERFVANPFVSGGRMYRSGDLARWTEQGLLEFAGRADEQVKIRGFRVEPGEIESVVASHPEVSQAAVVVREDRPGDKRLVAYVVPVTEGALDTAKLLEFAGERLPEYMVPTSVLTLDVLPLTVNGKLDRASLPAPDLATREGRAPATPTEEVLAGLFGEVLGLERVNAEESFFELGGDSLLAMRLIARLRSVLDTEVSIRELFGAPTVAGVARLIDGTETRGRVVLQPRTRPEVLPLSFAQQRMWLLNRMQEAGPGAAAAYNLPMALRISGELNVAALEAALNDVADRHETLRTVFPDVEGVPRQRILEGEAAHPPLTVVDTDEEHVEESLAERARRPFDVSTDLPWRVTLLRITPTDHVLLIVAHHIASDGWSMGVLARDMEAAYAARSADAEPGWDALPVQYADYALWQREVLGELEDEESLASAQLGYWREALAGAPQELTLPADRPRPAVPSFRSGSVPMGVDARTHARLVDVAGRGRATMFMVVHAAMSVLLSRMGAGEDIPLGTPIAGRGDAKLEDLAGFFVNTLVLRADLSGDPSFVDLLERVRETDLAAYAHQDVPFERLVDELNPTRTMSRNPLFQVMLALANVPEAEWELANLRVQPVRSVSEPPARFDLSVTLGERYDAEGAPAGLGGGILYAADLFDEATAQALSDRLARVLEQVAANPKIRLSDIDVLSPSERSSVVELWNDTARAVSARTVPELFAGWAASAADAVAVRSGDQALSYGELEARANQLGRYLRGLGVGRESRVGLCLPRGVEMVVGMLGVWKAGGAYVPLDPEYPVDRLVYMVADSAATVVLATGETVAQVAGDTVPVVALDAPAVAAAVAAESSESLEVSLAPEQLAYVIYTSGSTGRPKGVAVAHGGVANLAEVMRPVLGVSQGTVALQFASFSFDAAVLDVAVTLGGGGTLAVASSEERLEPQALAAMIRDAGVSVASVVPSLLGVLEPGSVPGVENWVLGAERLSADLAAKWRAQSRVWNTYGPTEATVITTATLLAEGITSDDAPPAIGAPIGNAQVFVLDDFLKPAPVGAVGELYVSGAGLARGYNGRPDLTAERFVANPFVQGGRMYRSGDLARWTADGLLEFAGRADEQVKIRGFRVEPGEIESVLASHPDVGQAAVMVREDRPGDKRLTAYVVPAVDDELDTARLLEFAGERLPDYMVPTSVLTLDALPLTVNGKLDRAVLPAPELSGRAEGRGPETPTEVVLAGLFGEVLGLERVNAEESFFELGGDSLLAMRLIARVRSVLDTEVSIRELFGAPTVAGVARAISDGEGGSRIKLVRQNRPEVLPLSFAQHRMWLLNRMQESPEAAAAYNLPLALRISGNLDVSVLTAALGDVAERHETLRTVFPDVEGVPHQRILEGEAAHPSLTVVDTDEATWQEALAAEAGRGFDVSTDLPWRVTLLRITPTDHVLLIVTHHIASDGWSMGVLARDLETAFAARDAGREPDWAPLPVQYADYALWQREVLGDLEDEESVVSSQLGYWREALAGAPQELVLPADRPRRAVPSFRSGSVPVGVDAETHARLVEVAGRGRATMFMVVHAAMSLLLARMGAGEDIPMGTPIAGRNDAELEDLAGFFVNTLVLRADLSGDPSFVDLLARMRDTDLAAYAHQDVPFERLVDELNPARSMSRNPFFQVMLALQNVPEARWELPGLEVSAVPPSEAPPARFDLSVTFAERYDAEGAPAGLGGGILYAADLFDEATVQALSGRLARVLEQVAADPDVRLADVEVLDEAERTRVVEEWNDTARAVSARTVPGLFAGWAASTPDAVAVRSGDQALSYGELEARANQLGRYLTGLGVGRESRVGLCLPRGIDMVVGMLGVWKAGGAYVPLDPDYPADRLAYMVSDSAASVVLAVSGTEDRVPAGVADVVLLDDRDIAATIGSKASEPLEVSLAPEQLAYVIYTSGSTGRPKGVAVAHGGVANLAEVMRPVLGVSQGTVALQFASFSFDAAVLDVAVTLGGGGSLAVASSEERLEPQALAAMIREAGVQVASVVPSLLGVLEPGSVPGVENWVLGAERLSADLAAKWRAQSRVWNTYGPTEATVITTATLLNEGITSDDAPPAIGAPIGNAQVFVLDDFLKPAPVGAVGELYVSGAGLARGYNGRPDLTAERFVANPFVSGGRMYRSGDLARWTADGLLEFAGRADEQVKIRGFRVEPGEIESVLASHPDVGQAAVVVREERPGDRRLIGYVVPEAQEIDQQQLREHVAKTLPDYMVPSAVMVLEALPLTANGKLDRTALPVPDLGERVSGRAPETETEKALCALFAEVLDLERVGVDDNFFDVGGNSTLAMRLAGRIRTELGAELSMRQFFGSSTPLGVARLLEAKVRPELRPVEHSGDVPLTASQRRTWQLDRTSPEAGAQQLPLALRLGGGLDAAALEAALGDVAARHEILRTTFTEDSHGSHGSEGTDGTDGHAGPRQHVLDADAEGARPALTVTPATEDELPELLAAHARHRFDLTTDTPWSQRLFTLSETDHVLSLVVHRIATDEASLDLLVRDLAAAYGARSEGRVSERAPLPLQFADYALWERELLQGEEDTDSLISDQLTYWRNTLGGLAPETPLPTDRPRPVRPSHRADSVPLTLGAEAHDRLMETAEEHGASAFMAVHTALAVLLTRLGAGTDLTLGTPLLRQDDEEGLDGVVGPFTDRLALRTDTTGDPTFVELLGRVRETTLSAYAYQDVPFERVVEELPLPPATSAHPVFQVMLEVQDDIAEKWDTSELPGLDTTRLPMEADVSPTDLSFHLTERQEDDGSPDGMDGTLRYATELFDRDTAAALAQRLVRVLEQVAEDPQLRLSQVDVLLGEDEHRRLVETVDDTAAGTPEGTVVELLSQQAARTPGAVAVTSAEGTLDYRELEAVTGRIARHLNALGAGAEDTVAVALPPTTALVTGLLGVLKSGAAFLPADPEGSLESILSAPGRPAALLCTAATAALLPAGSTVPVVLLDGPDGAVVSGSPRQKVAGHGQGAGQVPLPGNAALVYDATTPAGGTAGAVVEHTTLTSQVAHRMHGLPAGRAATLDARAPVPELITPLLAALCAGGGVRFGVPDQETADSSAQATTSPTTSLLVTTRDRLAALEEHPAGPLPFAEVLVADGAQVTVDDLAEWQRHRPDVPLVSSYGTAETATAWLDQRSGSGQLLPTETPTGRPVRNTRAYVLDDLLRPVPPGVVGDLYVAGSALARGYLDAPGRTGELFVACPFGPDGDRMLRTGERAKRTTAGLLTVRGAAHQDEQAGAGLRTVRNRDDLEVLLPLRSEGSRPPLFCLHHSTGLSWGYAAILPHLPADQPVYGIQARGLGGPEHLPGTVEEMVADYAEQIRSVQPSGPYHLLGWSVGGVIAQALATRLEELGEEVALLALLDGYPGVLGRSTFTGAEDPTGGAGAGVGAGDDTAGEIRDFQTSPGEGAPFPMGVSGPVVSNMQEIMRNTVSLAQDHTPRTSRGDITLFVATEDRPADLPVPEAVATWKPYTDGEIITHEVAVNHNDMLQAAHLSGIGRIVAEALRGSGQS